MEDYKDKVACNWWDQIDGFYSCMTSFEMNDHDSKDEDPTL